MEHPEIWYKSCSLSKNPSVLTRRGGRAMTRQWRKEKQSDLAKPGFSLDQCALLNPDFSYTLPRRSALVWGSHVFFFKSHLKLRLLRGQNYIRQYTINGRTVSSVCGIIRWWPGRTCATVCGFRMMKITQSCDL